MVGKNGVGSILKEGSLTSSGSSYDQPPLAFSDGSEKIDDARGEVILLKLEVEPFGRVVGRQFIKGTQFCEAGGGHVVYRFHPQQGKVLLPLFGRAHRSRNDVAGFQSKPSHLSE